MELQATLDVIKALDKNNFEAAREVLNSQGHSGLSYSLMLNMLKEFATDGDKFVEWLKENN